MTWGASGVSVGTIFIASDEADVTPEYKQAMIDYAKDIVRTNELSGSALTIINTPYVQQMLPLQHIHVFDILRSCGECI